MEPRPRNSPTIINRRRHPRRRTAFSFVEVLFAVMILGIGFIMLAGIFPVAISQTQSTGEDGSAANVARSAAAYLESLPGTNNPWTFPPDGVVHRFDDRPIQGPPQLGPQPTLWERVRGNLIVAEDPRYAWVPLFRRWSKPPRPTYPAVPQPPETLAHDFAEVTIFVVRVRNRTEYVPTLNGDLALDNNGQGTLVPREVRVTLEERNADPDRITIEGPNDHPVTTGAYVVIAGGTDTSGRSAAGRIYRVGNAVTEGNRNLYDLAPSNDMRIQPSPGGPMTEDVDNVPAYVIGEGVVPGTGYFGGAQDVAVYTTYIKLNP